MPTAPSIQTAALRSATTLVKLMPSPTEFRFTPAFVRWCYWSASRETGTNPAVRKMQRSTFKVGMEPLPGYVAMLSLPREGMGQLSNEEIPISART